MKMMKKMAAVLAAAAVVSVATASVTMNAGAVASTSEPPYTAWISYSIGGAQQWEPGEQGGEAATINGDGQYTATAAVPGGSETIELLILSTNINGYAFVEEGKDPWVDGTAKIAIDSVKIVRTDGSETEIAYTGPSDGAFSKENDGTSLRMNIFNEWGNSVRDISNKPTGGINDGDMISVTFTVSGINAGGGTAETTAPDENGSDTTTTAATNADGSAATTEAGGTTAAGGNGGNSSNNSSNSSSGSSNKSSGSSNSGSSNNAKTSETGDFGIAAVVLGAIATAALGAGAYTVTRRKK